MSYISRPLIKLSGSNIYIYISSALENNNNNNRYTNYCRGLLKCDSGGMAQVVCETFPTSRYSF